jgi:hypothetical protein
LFILLLQSGGRDAESVEGTRKIGAFEPIVPVPFSRVAILAGDSGAHFVINLIKNANNLSESGVGKPRSPVL